jgi:hypothetical protein
MYPWGNKMARKGVVILILAGIISASGCEKGVNKPSGPMRDYFPLHVGDIWTYVYNVGGQEKEESYSIVETRKIGEYEYFVFDKCPLPFFPADYEKGAETIVRKTEHGDVVLRFIDEDILYYKFSDTTLDSMRVVHIDSIPGYEAGMDFITSLQSTHDTVVTPAGTFTDSHRYTSWVGQIVDTGITVWFAPQVGPVRILYASGAGDMHLKSAVVGGRDYLTEEKKKRTMKR